jgi:hypothetical protein
LEACCPLLLQFFAGAAKNGGSSTRLGACKSNGEMKGPVKMQCSITTYNGVVQSNLSHVRRVLDDVYEDVEVGSNTKFFQEQGLQIMEHRKF